MTRDDWLFLSLMALLTAPGIAVHWRRRHLDPRAWSTI